MFFAHEWWHKTASKSLTEASKGLSEASKGLTEAPEAPDADEEERVTDAAVIFFHVEQGDEEDRAGALRKFLKNTKWIAGKFGTKKVVLHSFNHLSTSKSSPEFAKGVLEEAEERLTLSGFSVHSTPFGYFNEFKMHVAGDSLAKVYKEF